METSKEKISFQDYYKNLSFVQGELRAKICDKLEISYKTFYNKINSDSWTTIEREAIEKIMDEFIIELSKTL